MDQPHPRDFAERGSQRWLQVAVCRAPDLLDQALRQSGAIGPAATVKWVSPLPKDRFAEYQDERALQALGLGSLPVRRLSDFWPKGGPVWDALGVSSEGQPILLEAKAHISEAASPPSKAGAKSLERIEAALAEARAWYAPQSRAVWSKALYQYANRLAFQYFLAKVNRVPSRLVFLDFCHDAEMDGPETPEMWKGAAEMIHALLGLPKDLTQKGVFHAYLDVRLLKALA